MERDNILNAIKLRIFRNEYGLKDRLSKKNVVNIEYSTVDNIGDSLSPVIVNWMLKQKGIDGEKKLSRTKHLLAVGSVVGRGRFDASIWGSGILKERSKWIIERQHLYRKYEICAVRGPVTRKAFLDAGYSCAEIYGDPAILMPEIYKTTVNEKRYDFSLILHHRTEIADQADESNYQFVVPSYIHTIDPKTDDYKFFIDEIVSSKYVISSSLHGIILAESYHVPAIFLNWGMEDQTVKFEDWYLSTNRKMKYASSLEEALRMTPMPLPDLEEMRKNLIKSFPYHLWDH